MKKILFLVMLCAITIGATAQKQKNLFSKDFVKESVEKALNGKHVTTAEDKKALAKIEKGLRSAVNGNPEVIKITKDVYIVLDEESITVRDNKRNIQSGYYKRGEVWGADIAEVMIVELKNIK